MSMISAQIDELRRYADRADGTFPMLASALRDAADTIWQLRGDLQRANAENAKLRDGAYAMRQLYEDELKHALDENAKLRKLVRHLRECTRHNVCAACEYADDVCDFDYDMRELGVEVDG